MTLEHGLVAVLRANSGVSALVINATSPQTWRIYPEVLPQAVAYPAIRYARVSTNFGQSLGGPTAHNQVRIQIDVWDKTHDGCRTAADAVKAAINGVRGNFGGVSIDHAYLENFAHLSEIDGSREDFRVTMDLVVNLTE